ncbi:MAG: MFS transporter, partial [Rhodospirillales bacterium]|nr:MFS transporter [Rhodospirillales bacterium]
MTHEPSFSSPRWVAARLALFYAALFVVIGIFMPYWPIWLQSRGLDEVQIGMVFAVAMLTRTVAMPTAVHVADLLGKRHLTMRFLAAGAAGVYLLYGLTWNFWTVLPVAALAACFLSPLMPLAENLTVRAVYRQKLDYGHIRLWGSVTFILATVAGGYILEGQPPDLVWWMIVGAIALTFGATLLLPP